MPFADLNGAYIKDSNLTQANLANADLNGVTVTKSSLKGASLRDADARGSEWTHVNMQNTDLTGTNFSADYVNPDDYPDENWNWISQEELFWIWQSNLSNVDFKGATITPKTLFAGAQFEKVKNLPENLNISVEDAKKFQEDFSKRWNETHPD